MLERKIALVLNGGGARGSYQSGVIRALYEIIKKDQNLFQIITGNSAGAINAIFLAGSARDWGSATQYLIDLWMRIKPEDVIDVSQYTMTQMGAKWVKGSFLKSERDGEILNSFFNTDPLKKLINREIDFNEIHQLIQEELLTGVSISTTNYFSGSNVIFYDAAKTVKDWTKKDRLTIKTEINCDHVMGSSAIPLFFPPTKIGNSYFGDGCIRQVTPLSPAIHMGAQKIITIGIRHKNSTDLIKKMIDSNTDSPQISQIIGVMLNSIFLDSLEVDVDRLQKTNIMVDIMGKNAPWRNIPIISIVPSRDLGLMTNELDKKLPFMMRFILKNFGVSGTSGLELLSYLAFDSSYTTQVCELGYNDTMLRKKEILDFIDS